MSVWIWSSLDKCLFEFDRKYPRRMCRMSRKEKDSPSVKYLFKVIIEDSNLMLNILVNAFKVQNKDITTKQYETTVTPLLLILNTFGTLLNISL